MEEQIKFGTDGWRAVMSDQFTIRNVQRVAQATCEALRETAKSKLVLVGYDRRFLSDRFALVAAQVAVGNGFRVELSDRSLSSPALSFQVKSRKAAIGFMMTASHNPYYFNGFKLKGSHGGSVDETFTQLVEKYLDRNPVQSKSVEIPKVDFVSDYLSQLRKWVQIDGFKRLQGPCVFDGMNGPGGELFQELLGGKNHTIIIRKEKDPLFGNGAPEPIESHLALLKETILKNKALAGFAVDGDADRIGVIDDKGRYLPPHTVMPLLILHMIEGRKLKGKIIQTVSMGYLPGRIAKHFKFDFEETAVGFKFIAKKMLEEKVLFGGEESGGYGVGLWSPERDGLLCALLLMEMMAERKKPLSALVDEMKTRFGESHFKRVDFVLSKPVDKTSWSANIQTHLNQSLGAYEIKEVKTIDGLKIVTSDESWVLMRPSGTEPLIRTYSEGTKQKVVDELLIEAERLVHLPPPQTEKERLAEAVKKKKMLKYQKSKR